MAKDKDRALNPAAAQRKADKQKALKKGKAQVAAQRTSRLATRNPHRLETQISDLHALRESQGGKLNARDTKHLEELERDVARVKKARETLGDKAPTFNQQRGGASDRGGGQHEGRSGGRGAYTGLGKRVRDDADGGDGGESEETDEDVRRIPWPRDTPPPFPHHRPDRQNPRNANEQPLGRDRRTLLGQHEQEEAGASKPPDTSLPPRPTAQPKTTYESKPQVRDLRAEATKAFVPGVVRRKIEAGKGRGPGGRLLEEEEVGRLEGEGYTFGGGGQGGGQGGGVDGGEMVADAVPEIGLGGMEGVEEMRRLREEEEAFRREIEGDDGGLGLGGDDDKGGGEGDKEKGRELQARLEEVSDEDT